MSNQDEATLNDSQGDATQSPAHDSVEISAEASEAAGVEVPTQDDAPQVEAPAEEEAPIEVTPKMIRKLKDDQLMMLAEQAGQAEGFRDLAARAQAEMENFRKRKERESAEERRYAIVPFVREMLTSLDNLDRALVAAKQAEENGALLQGVEMTRDLMIRTMHKFGVEAIDAAGCEFDPEVHEALMMGNDADQPDNVILDCFETGWRMHERVIRPAKVRVNKLES